MEFPLTLTEWLIASAVVCAGALVQGSIGYGVALVGAPLLFLINPQLVPAPMIVIGMSLPLMILLRDWRAVQTRDVAWGLPGSAIGILAAAILLGSIPDETLGVVFGSLVLLGVALSLLGNMPDPRPQHVLGAAGLSGFMATTTSIGGPPLALIYQNVRGPRLRGTLSAIFVPAGVLSLGALAWVGRFGVAELIMGLALFPGMLLGFAVSNRTARFLDHAWLRFAVLAISALAGGSALSNALLN